MKKLNIFVIAIALLSILASCDPNPGSIIPNPQEKEVLGFTAAVDGSTVRLEAPVWFGKEKSDLPTLYFSTDNGTTWNEYGFSASMGFGYSGPAITLNQNQVVYFVGEGGTFSYNSMAYLRFSMTGSIYAGGNIMSLLDKDFADSTKSVAVPALTDHMFYSLFSGCTALKSAPELPAETLAPNCYEKLFNGCSALVSAPQSLPATTLATDCYLNMFKGCTSMVNAPSTIAATNLIEGCYKGLFKGCTALTTVPTLPATALADNCYEEMFSGCTSLVNAMDSLSPTTLAEECFKSMFAGCTALSKAPKLESSSLADGCYAYMFSGCTSLTAMPNLGVENISGAAECYSHMFEGCTNITVVDNLGATTLGEDSLSYMFSGCSNLRKLFIGFTDWNASEDATDHWLNGVPSSGMVIASDSLVVGTASSSTVPSGWTKVTRDEYDELYGPLCLTAVEASGITLAKIGNPGTISLLYSTDGQQTWSAYTVETEINLSAGSKVCFKTAEAGLGFSDSDQAFYRFTITGETQASGNIMWLLDPTGEGKTITDAYAFAHLFDGSYELTVAPQLPATTLAAHCYEAMFAGTGLEETPSLTDATDLADCCFCDMFSGCQELEEVSALPVMTLATGCYSGMFMGCTDLESAPELPATTLAADCYKSMFKACTSLETAPVLAATTLATGCYNGMFAGCTDLESAPELMAATLVSDCYDNMFNGCTKIDSLTVGFADFGSGNTDDWLAGAATSGLIVGPCTCSSKSDSTVPTGWAAVDPSVGLAFVAKTDGAIGFAKNGTPTVNASISYSTDGGTTWNAYTPSTTSVADITVTTGDVVYFKGTNTALSNSISAYYKFIMTATFEAYGDVTRLLGDNVTTITQKYCFCQLFLNCTSLIRAPKIGLTTLSEDGLEKMFKGCTNLVVGPDMSSITTVAKKSCFYMFDTCTKLESVQMPKATTMYQECYAYMFSGCSALKSVSISATTLATKCFNYMFKNCSGLKSLTVAFTAWNPGGLSSTNVPTNSWLTGAGGTGSILYCPAALDTSVKGISNVPNDWTVKN